MGLRQIFNIQKKYIDAFFNIKKGNFYEGWCLLEEIEVYFSSFDRHFEHTGENYKMKFIKKYVEKLQSVFPYTHFLSPGFIVNKFKCNICGKTYKLRKKCEHKVGDIYDGKMCVKVAMDCEFLNIALVKNPVQKYSVFFNKGKDNYDYSLINEIISNLESPFHSWNYTVSNKLHSHTKFKHLSEQDNCPCGSGKKYKNCCLNEKGVLMPQYQISLSVKPKNKLEEKFFNSTNNDSSEKKIKQAKNLILKSGF